MDVILLSRNDPDTGLQLFKSIEKHRLDITRVAFTGGRDPFDYLEAFNACLFLSANPTDVTEALEKSVRVQDLFFPPSLSMTIMETNYALPSTSTEC